MLYSDVDFDGWEVRKVDEYADGRRNLAGDGVETGSTFLGEAQTPSIEEINADPQFDAVEISAEEFEMIWRAAKDWFELP